MPFQTASVWWTTLTQEERQDLADFSDQIPQPQPDVLVIGGGIVGLATAYFAAERGLKVQVITESSHLADDANGTLGDIFPNAVRWRLSPQAQPLAQSSRDWWAKLAVRPDFQVDWRVTGAVMVDECHLTPDPRHKMLELLEEGYSVRDVDAEQVALLEPQLRSLPAGGLQFPSEAVLHPLKAASGLVRGIRRFQGRIATACPIQRVERHDSTLVAVETARGLIRPRLVVIDQIESLDQFPECQSTITPVQPLVLEQRVLLATAPTGPILNRPVLHQEWILQLKSGEIVVEMPLSADDQFRLSNPQIEPRVLENIRRQVVQLLPELDTIPFVTHWTAATTTNAAKRPVIDKCQVDSNVWNYRDLSSSRLLLAPLIGRLLTDWMTTGQRPEDLVPFADLP